MVGDTGSLETMSVVESLVKLGEKQPTENENGSSEETPEVSLLNGHAFWFKMLWVDKAESLQVLSKFRITVPYITSSGENRAKNVNTVK